MYNFSTYSRLKQLAILHCGLVSIRYFHGEDALHRLKEKYLVTELTALSL